MYTSDRIRSHLQRALDEAETALSEGNYPIGSILVSSDGSVVSATRNQCTTNSDVTAHAEILGIRKAGSRILKDAPGEHWLFSTLEPCFGCSFFIARTNIRHVVSALKDPHKGGTGDLLKLEQFRPFFAHIDIVNEPFPDFANRSRDLMVRYFLNAGRADAARFYGYTGE